MDSEAFRNTYKEINVQDCVFAKAILTRQAACRRAEWFCIAEREGVRCLDAEARARCLELTATLRRQARFALKARRDPGELAYAQGMRVQMGGLRGIAEALESGTRADGLVEDIDDLVEKALGRFGTIDRLPFARIMRHIAAYRGRRRRRRHKG